MLPISLLSQRIAAATASPHEKSAILPDIMMPAGDLVLNGECSREASMTARN